MFKWKLRACRVQAGLTQKEVAAELGVSEVSLVAYETGKRTFIRLWRRKAGVK